VIGNRDRPLDHGEVRVARVADQKLVAVGLVVWADASLSRHGPEPRPFTATFAEHRPFLGRCLQANQRHRLLEQPSHRTNSSARSPVVPRSSNQSWPPHATPSPCNSRDQSMSLTCPLGHACTKRTGTTGQSFRLRLPVGSSPEVAPLHERLAVHQRTRPPVLLGAHLELSDEPLGELPRDDADAEFILALRHRGRAQLEEGQPEPTTQVREQSRLGDKLGISRPVLEAGDEHGVVGRSTRAPGPYVEMIWLWRILTMLTSPPGCRRRGGAR
jgi:hypothetical protein